MRATIATVGELFGLLQLVGETVMIDQIGPLKIFRGNQVTYRITVTDDADARVNLTAYGIECEAKAELGGADPAAIACSIGDGITLLTQSGATLGQADIVITSAKSGIAPALYWLDVVTILAGVRVHVIPPRELTIANVVNLPA